MNLFIAPHPPIILPQIGKGEEERASNTILGMQKIAEDIKNIKPETIAIITPHGNVFGDALCINVEENLLGDFSQFGHSKIKFNIKNDVKKAQEMCLELGKNNINNLALNKKTAKQ